MSESRISIRLIGDTRAYQPGQQLAGEFFVDIDEPHDIRAVEVSVLWFTEGKGDEDMAVHYFQRVANDNGQFIDMRQSQHFETELPSSPLSYDGVIVKIQWCVRIRVFLNRGRDIATEQPFRLGTVPRGLPVKVDEPTGDVESSEEVPVAATSETTKPETTKPETTKPETTASESTAPETPATDTTATDVDPVDTGAEQTNMLENSAADRSQIDRRTTEAAADTGRSATEADVMDADTDTHATELDRVDTSASDSGGPSD